VPKLFWSVSNSPKNLFLPGKRFLEKELWLLIGNYKKMFLLVQTSLGGNLIVPPHSPPQIQCLSDSGTPCVLLQECATICKVPLTEKALATYVCVFPPKPVYSKNQVPLSVRCHYVCVPLSVARLFWVAAKICLNGLDLVLTGLNMF
jgi:hypothetical protein